MVAGLQLPIETDNVGHLYLKIAFCLKGQNNNCNKNLLYAQIYWLMSHLNSNPTLAASEFFFKKISSIK